MERCNAGYKKEILLTCYDALEQQGFTRFRKGAVDWPIENGFHCWVGLNTGLYPDHVAISPFCGIHSVSIERMWTSLKRGSRPSQYNRGNATFAVHLGEIAPNENVFRFMRSTNVKAEAFRLAELYFKAGLPFAKSLANYAALLPCLRDRVSRLGAYPERVACCLFLMGCVGEAKSFTANFRRGHEEYFEGFAVPFLSMIEEFQAK